MKTYILYTTSKSARVQEQADVFASEISKTKGRGLVRVLVVHKLPKRAVTAIDADGHKKPTWDWFRSTFPKGDHNGVIFHFTPYYRAKWGITTTINGARNPDNRDFPEFFICDDLSVKAAPSYPEWVTGFLRKLFHEHAHYDEDLDDELGNVLTQTSVHDMDYKLKKIHLYHYLVDYRGQAFKESVQAVMNSVIKLIKQYV